MVIPWRSFLLSVAVNVNPLVAELREVASEGRVSWQSQCDAAEGYDLTVAEVEAEILAAGLMPTRYQRNQNTLTAAQQQSLFNSKVAVVGAGGLGGYVAEQLVRLGVGTLRIIDGDTFAEHNLNRQLFALPENLGRAKVEVAAERLRAVNPAVTIVPFRTMLTADNMEFLFGGMDCVVDATDDVPTRLTMVEACRSLDIPMVHAAIAGWYGHVVTIYPGDQGLSKIYRNFSAGKGVELHLGNPAFAPAVAAGLEAAEVCKVLLNTGKSLKNRQLLFDLYSMEMEEIPLL